MITCKYCKGKVEYSIYLVAPNRTTNHPCGHYYFGNINLTEDNVLETEDGDTTI